MRESNRADTAASLLRELRKEQGRTLQEAAADLGLAPSHLSRVERGERGITPELRRRISDCYGVPADVLAIAEGRVPQDIQAILLEHPEELDRLRAAHGRTTGE